MPITSRVTYTIHKLFLLNITHTTHVFYIFLFDISVKQCSQHTGPDVVISTAAFHARVRVSVPGLCGLNKTKMFLPHPLVKH